jgi:hypothetical protein
LKQAEARIIAVISEAPALIFSDSGGTFSSMNKRNSDWYIPPEVRGLLILAFVPMCFAVCVGLLSFVLLPLLARLKTDDLLTVYSFGLGTSLLGIVMLFVARLPLYKQRRFFIFGPKQLDQRHRRIYWLAYVFVAASLLLLWLVWLKSHEL